VSDDQSLQTADNVATGWVLTGISRAARFLALAGRVMLPLESMQKQGLVLQDLQNPESAGASSSVISEVCDAARNHLAAARQNKNAVDLKGLPVFLLATLADSYLSGLERAEYNIYDTNVIRQRPAIARVWWNNWRKRF
jgi:phytoene/squalene synthetase